MTPARPLAHGLASPSLSQRSLTALLCVIAELVIGVAAMFGMRNRRQARVCDTIPMPEALPQATRDTYQKETTTPPTGLMLSLSKHEAVLTTSRPAPASFDKLRMRRSLTVLATPTIVIPDTPRSRRANARKEWAREPEPRGRTHSQAIQPLASRSRVPRAGNDTAVAGQSAPA